MRPSLTALFLVGCATAIGCTTPAASGAGTAATASADTAAAGSDSSVAGDSSVGDAATVDVATADSTKIYDTFAPSKVTLQSTTKLYELTLDGPMSTFAGQNISLTLSIATSGPVKFVDPKVTFQKAITGDKPLKAPKLTVAPPPLTWTISDLVPASAGKWVLHIELANGDGADFAINVEP